LIDKSLKELSEINLKTTQVQFKKITTLKQGHSFGELALTNQDGKREARITCTENTSLGVIHRHDYEQCLDKIQAEH